VACGADADSGEPGICADADVAVAMTSNTVRLKPDTAFGEQITRTLPFNYSLNHKGGDVAGPAEGV
jgi:hypothetical protein